MKLSPGRQNRWELADENGKSITDLSPDAEKAAIDASEGGYSTLPDGRRYFLRLAPKTDCALTGYLAATRRKTRI